MVCHRNIDVKARRYAGRHAVCVDPGQRTGGRDRMAHGGARGSGRSRLNPYSGGPFLEGRDHKPQRGSSADEASWERLMVLRSQPGSGLNSQCAGEPARSKRLSRPRASDGRDYHNECGWLKPVAQADTVASRTKLWWISCSSGRSKKGLRPKACGAISGQRSDGGSDAAEAGRLVNLRPPSKVGDPGTRKKRLLGWSQ
jgi:hypothetical protein